MDTIYSNSGLSLTQDQYFQIVNGRLRAIQADTTNNQVKLFFEKKENDAADNDATSEHLVFDVTDGKEAEVAESIIYSINGLQKNSGVITLLDSPSKRQEGLLGIDMPAFTIASKALALNAAVGPTLATATVGANYSLTVVDESDADKTLTKTGVIATADDALTFTSAEMGAEGFAAADVVTFTVVLTNPNDVGPGHTVTDTTNSLTAS